MSGECFPIKQDDYIRAVLSHTEGNFLSQVRMPVWHKPLKRLEQYHYSTKNPTLQKLLRRASRYGPRRNVNKLLRGLQPYGGSRGGWSIERQLCGLWTIFKTISGTSTRFDFHFAPMRCFSDPDRTSGYNSGPSLSHRHQMDARQAESGNYYADHSAGNGKRLAFCSQEVCKSFDSLAPEFGPRAFQRRLLPRRPDHSPSAGFAARPSSHRHAPSSGDSATGVSRPDQRGNNQSLLSTLDGKSLRTCYRSSFNTPDRVSARPARRGIFICSRNTSSGLENRLNL